MRLRLTTLLPAKPEEIWPAILRPTTFTRVVRGLMRVAWIDVPPPRFSPGQAIRLRLWLFGIVPTWRHTLSIERCEPGTRGEPGPWQMQTREQGGPLRRWNHTLRLVPAADGQTWYTDEVDLDAGLLTPLAWLMALGFFAFRQRRWRRELHEILVAAHVAAGEM